jgi:hypothetical protein
MSSLNSLGLRSARLAPRHHTGVEHVVVQRPLQRVLAFRNRSIDDVVNDPIVKNEIFGYWKLHKQIIRSSEVVELERQWNAPRPRRR